MTKEVKVKGNNYNLEDKDAAFVEAIQELTNAIKRLSGELRHG